MSQKSGSDRWYLGPDEDDPHKKLWYWDTEGKDDLNELFRRVGEGKGTADDHEIFWACLLDRFITRSFQRQPLEPWIANALAEQFYKVMKGGDWDIEIPLPGRASTSPRTREQRAVHIYCDVVNAIKKDGLGVTEAITKAAGNASVSYETARADYYNWLKRFSKKSDKE